MDETVTDADTTPSVATEEPAPDSDADPPTQPRWADSLLKTTREPIHYIRK